MGLGSVLKTMYPFLHAALSAGGPFGTMAADAIGKKLGVKVDPTVEGASKALADAQAKDPDAMLKLQESEQAFQLQMEKLGLDSAEKIAQIDALDRASARGREIAVKDRLPAILALVVTAGFFLLLALLAYKEVPVSSQSILQVLIGSLGTAWIGIVNYYFGSSSGSASKTAIMARQAEEKR